MHIGIDVREACRDKKTGKGQWTYHFVSELLERRDIRLTLYADALLPSEWASLIAERSGPDEKNFPLFHCFPPGLRWHVTIAFLQRHNAKANDAYVSTTSYIAPFFMGKTHKVVPVVHDLIAFLDESHDRKAKMIERLTLRRALGSAAHVCTVSEHTKSDLLARYPFLPSEKITPIFAGPTSTNIVPASPSSTPTILCISTLAPRKNQLRLIQAFDALPSPLRDAATLLLVGGRGWHDDEIVATAQRTKGVEWKGYLPQDECDELLRRTTLLAFPSLYEGFGFPVLDAFSAGVPVLTSDRGSMKEVAGDAAMLVDPENVDSMKQGLSRLLSDENLRKELVEKGKSRAERFSWKRTVDLFLDAMKKDGVHSERAGNPI